MLQSLAQDIVTDEHRSLVVEQRVDTLLTASAITLVHHIVVYERCRMKQLQSKRSMQHPLAHRTLSLGREQCQYGAHLLAPSLGKMVESNFQQRIVMIQRLTKHRIESLKLLPDRTLYQR